MRWLLVVAVLPLLGCEEETPPARAPTHNDAATIEHERVVQAWLAEPNEKWIEGTDDAPSLRPAVVRLAGDPRIDRRLAVLREWIDQVTLNSPEKRAERQAAAEERGRAEAAAALEARCSSGHADRLAFLKDQADERARRAARDAAEAERQLKIDEYVRTHCRSTTEPITERRMCDDGSDVAKICDVTIGWAGVRTCPANAPYPELRGRSSAPLAGSGGNSDPSRVARRVAPMGPRWVRECAEYDRKIAGERGETYPSDP